MPAKWFEDYQKLSQKTRFLSQLGAFFVSLFAFLSCWHIFYALSNNPSVVNHLGNKLIVAVGFHLLVGIVFASRFVSLFFSSKRSFHISQILWMIGELALLGFFIATRFALYGSFFPPETAISFGMDSYPTLFLYADSSLELMSLIYFFVSPVRQIMTGFIAYFNSK